jgi:PEP-CTERM motif
MRTKLFGVAALLGFCITSVTTGSAEAVTIGLDDFGLNAVVVPLNATVSDNIISYMFDVPVDRAGVWVGSYPAGYPLFWATNAEGAYLGGSPFILSDASTGGDSSQDPIKTIYFHLHAGMPAAATLTIIDIIYEQGVTEFHTASTVTVPHSDAVPLPAALPLFASGLGVMAWMARRKKRKAAAEA